jgi:transaldolase
MTTNNPLRQLNRLGQQAWLDNLSRTLLREGGLENLIAEDAICGVTSNPAIFYKAIAESPYYRDELAELKASDLSAEARYEKLVISDIRDACDALRPTFDATSGEAGYVSLEVSPELAHDEAGTISAARRLHAEVNRPNVLIKVPATPAGVRAFEQLTALGINVNVTLMFSLRHQRDIADAYIRGAQRWVAGGGDPHSLRSVASLFMSRVDTLLDKKLDAIGTPEALALRGKAAVALGKLAWQQYREIFEGSGFADLAAAGVRPQTPLWASTGVKNPTYPDLMYVEPLIGPNTVNTLPDATLAAFRDHGKAEVTLTSGIADAAATFEALRELGLDPDEAGEQLQDEGVVLFAQAFEKLLALTA